MDCSCLFYGPAVARLPSRCLIAVVHSSYLISCLTFCLSYLRYYLIILAPMSMHIILYSREMPNGIATTNGREVTDFVRLASRADS